MAKTAWIERNKRKAETVKISKGINGLPGEFKARLITDDILEHAGGIVEIGSLLIQIRQPGVLAERDRPGIGGHFA